MSKIGILLPVLVLAAALGACAAPATYYVDAVAGNDGNAGTAAAPWRSLQKAADAMRAGDTAVVRAGAYGQRVRVRVSGTAAAPIVFWAEGAVETRGFTVLADFVVIRGFGISTTGPKYDTETAGIYLAGRGCLVEGNRFHQTAYVGVLLDRASRGCVLRGNRLEQCALAGMEVLGAGHLVERNEVLDTRTQVGGNLYQDANGFSVFGPGHVFRGNVIAGFTMAQPGDPHVDGFQSWTSPPYTAVTDAVFERNRIDLPLCTTVSHAAGFMFQGSPARVTIRNNVIRAGRGIQLTTGSGLRVWHNTIVGDMRWPLDHGPSGILVENTGGSDVRNNIICDFPNRAIWSTGNSGLVCDYNCAWNSDGSMPGGARQPHDLWAVDPRMVGMAGLDARLLPGSPCIDRGIPLPGVTDDFEGRARPSGSGFDIGAYEFTAAPYRPFVAFSSTPPAGRAPLRVEVDAASSYDPDGVIVLLSWDFGDGGTASGVRAAHVFTRPGVYRVRLTATDDSGLTQSADDLVRVLDPSSDASRETGGGGSRVPIRSPGIA